MPTFSQLQEILEILEHNDTTTFDQYQITLMADSSKQFKWAYFNKKMKESIRTYENIEKWRAIITTCIWRVIAESLYWGQTLRINVSTTAVGKKLLQLGKN